VSDERPYLPGQKDPADMPDVVASRVVYRGKIVSLKVDEIALPAGGTAIREVVEHPGAVVILAIDDEECVYLVDQYRHAVKRHLLELPAGGLEPGEEPLERAKRELREEVGLAAGEWTYLGWFFSSPGFANEKLHAFAARRLTPTDGTPDDDEDLSVVRYPLRTLLSELDRVRDAKTLAALCLLANDPRLPITMT
jgi:ADP-ribose pyrophosphatase